MDLTGAHEKYNISNIHFCRVLEGGNRSDIIIGQAHKAMENKKSHMVILEDMENYLKEDLKKLLLSAYNSPSGIILGIRNHINSDESFSERFWRKLSNFWFRLQTKNCIEDSTSSLRVYPTFIFSNLKLNQKGPAFDTEVIVKSSWAGISISEVKLNGYYRCAHHRGNFLRRLLDVIFITLLNIHYTMRSITPIPHRKIIDHQESGQKISVLYPLRSLKTLLTENISPKQLASAGALGFFLGTLPLIGFHTVFILFASNFFRLNKVAALATSQLCMPPIIPALCIEVGHFLRHGVFLTEISIETLGFQAMERLFEWFIGALFLAPLLSAIIGLVIFTLASIIQKESRQKVQ